MNLTLMVVRPPPIMKPFALSLSKGIFVKQVVRQAHHERCFTLNECSQRGAVWGSGIARIKSACKAQGLAEPSICEKGDSVDVEFYRPVPDSAQTVPYTDDEVPDSVQVVPDTAGKVPDSGRVVPDSGQTVPDSVALLATLCVSI